MLVSVGCEGELQTAVPTLEKNPWRFPEPQIELLSSPDFRLRAMAANNLSRMGAQAEAAIPELEKALDDQHPKVRKLAKEALEKIRAELSKADAS